MALLGTPQIALAAADRWTGALHPLGALLVLVLAAGIAHRDFQRRRPASRRAIVPSPRVKHQGQR
jgi:hypothetical protein